MACNYSLAEPLHHMELLQLVQQRAEAAKSPQRYHQVTDVNPRQSGSDPNKATPFLCSSTTCVLLAVPAQQSQILMSRLL